MKDLVFSLTVFCILISTASCSSRHRKSDEIKYVDSESIYEQNIQDSTLATGWYYILETENGFKRQLDKTEEFYFIDPKPILVKEHFDKLEIFETNFHGQYENYVGLSIQIHKNYKDLWANATEKSMYKRLGLVINNKLVNAPMVNARIENGMSSLNRIEYSRDELENFKKQIE